MRSGNPALSKTALNTALRSEYDYAAGAMTIEGTTTKTGILLALVVATGSVSWNLLGQGSPLAMPLIFGGLIAGLILALVLAFKAAWAPFIAPLYAVAEGLFLGGISRIYEGAYSGIVLQAILLTFTTLFALLVAYRTGWIKVTEGFRAGVFAATAGIGLVYLATWILGFFGMQIPYIHGSGAIGIGFSIFVVIIAALNLVMDFDIIDQGVSQGWPKRMEWYGAFAVLVTLVWLYLEILRLLAKINSRD